MATKKDARTGKKPKGISKEGLIVILVVAAIIGLFFAAYYLFGALNKVEYRGLVFTKDKIGEIPIYRYTYHYTADGQNYNYNFYVRTNPEKNTVPVEGEIEFPEKRTAYVGINSTGLSQCNQSNIAIGGFTSFLVNNQIKVKVGTLDLEESKTNNYTLVNCVSYPNNPVVLLYAGETTKIYSQDNLCYRIEVANCEILEALEKFEISALADAKARGQQ